MPERRIASGLSLFISFVALGISLFSAEQARRAAAANERLAGIAEEQTRPRISVSSPLAILAGETMTISASIRNVGNAPATITAVTVNTLDADQRGVYRMVAADNAILYPGDERKLSLVKPRVIRRGGLRLDYGDLDPGTFTFAVSYKLLGKSELQFDESVLFAHLPWLHESSRTVRR